MFVFQISTQYVIFLNKYNSLFNGCINLNIAVDLESHLSFPAEITLIA